MRTSILTLLLLSSVFVFEAQGIRLEKGFTSFEHQITHDEGSLQIKLTNGVVGEVFMCKNGQCSGNKRKLATKSLPSSTAPTTASKKTKNVGEKEERLSLNSSPVSEHREVGTEQYPENGNIVEMDYSPARRKPPIHN